MECATSKIVYKKHYIPLESNPELFTELIHRLGVSEVVSFQDVLSINDPELIAFIPRPVLALILVFPTSPAYEEHVAREVTSRSDYEKSGDEEEVMWFKQTINNACGLYGILHAISNGEASAFINANSNLDRLFKHCRPLKPADRAQMLEDDAELESAYKAVALQGDSEVPEDPEAEVDFHYICFVKSSKSGNLYEMDGDRKGPIDRGPLGPNDDVLSPTALTAVKKYIEREEGRNSAFSLLALVIA